MIRIEEGKPGGRNAAGPARDPAVPHAGTPLREILFDISHTSGDSAGSSGDGRLPVSQQDAITIDDDAHQPLGTILGGPPVGQPIKGELVSPKEERVSGDAVAPPVSSKIDEVIEVSSDEGYIDEQAPDEIRERRIAEARKVMGLKPKKELKDAQGQSDMTAAEDWRTQDVPEVIKMLHNPDEGLVKKALMRLHVRWWHATIEQLSQTLRAAGSPPRAISMVPNVVNSCQICRNWKRPSNRTTLAGELSTKLTEY